MGRRDREFGIAMYTLLYLKWIARDFPGGPVVKIPRFCCRGSILVRELRSHMLHSVAKKPVLKWITNKDLLYSIGNFTKYSVITIWEKNLERNGYMYMYN